MSRVLLIEDNPANMKLLRDLLVRQGHKVLTAYEAATGLQLAQQKALDLIVLDIQLPGIDGLQAAKQLRSRPATRTTPILAVTAHAMRGDEARILEAGFDRYLAKPIRYREFLRVVAEMIEQRSAVDPACGKEGNDAGPAPAESEDVGSRMERSPGPATE